jgi:hypothetical protein
MTTPQPPPPPDRSPIQLPPPLLRQWVFPLLCVLMLTPSNFPRIIVPPLSTHVPHLRSSLWTPPPHTAVISLVKGVLLIRSTSLLTPATPRSIIGPVFRASYSHYPRSSLPRWSTGDRQNSVTGHYFRTDIIPSWLRQMIDRPAEKEWTGFGKDVLTRPEC